MQIIALLLTLALSGAAGGWKGKDRPRLTKTRLYRTSRLHRLSENLDPIRQYCEHSTYPRCAYTGEIKHRKIRPLREVLDEQDEVLADRLDEAYEGRMPEDVSWKCACGETDPNKMGSPWRCDWCAYEGAYWCCRDCDGYGEMREANDRIWDDTWDEAAASPEWGNHVPVTIAPEEALMAKFVRADLTRA